MINSISRVILFIISIPLCLVISVFLALAYMARFIFVLIGESFKSLKGLVQRGRGEIGRR